MVFLDTNIWLELCALKNPVKDYEVKQAIAASNLLKNLIDRNIEIITNKNQLLELTFVIEKTKLKAYNAKLKKNGQKQLNSIKEYRRTKDFKESIDIVKSAIDDVLHWTKDLGYIDFEINNIIDASCELDITDALYYKMCVENKISFYTFDKEIKEFDVKGLRDTVVLVS